MATKVLCDQEVSQKADYQANWHVQDSEKEHRTEEISEEFDRKIQDAESQDLEKVPRKEEIRNKHYKTSSRARRGSDIKYSLRRKTNNISLLQKEEMVQKQAKKPRWYNQTYIMFLALRLAGSPLPRAALIPRALELADLVTKECNLPPLFGGKTPKNTASGLLTENRDKMFTSFIDEKTKKIYFAPSFKPGDFDACLEVYNRWISNLAGRIWPLQFGDIVQPGPPRNGSTLENESDSKKLPGDLTTPENIANAAEKIKMETMAQENSNSELPTPTMDDPNIFIPREVGDILEVKTSTIPNSGRGVFAKIYIPPGIILGYYFGIPYPEDEFDYYKGDVGQSSEFAHRYRLTVLDATDSEGKPFWNHPLVFCPLHFINEKIGQQNVVFHEGTEVNQIFCMSIKPIYPGEELFVNYGPEVHRNWLDNADDTHKSNDVPLNQQSNLPPKPAEPLSKPLIDCILSLSGSKRFTKGLNAEEKNIFNSTHTESSS